MEDGRWYSNEKQCQREEDVTGLTDGCITASPIYIR